MSVRIDVRSLSASRGPARLFRDVTFALGAGELLCVRGPNGSGKTTLLRCVAGLTRPDAGTIEREGGVLYAGHLAGLKDDLTARENLAFALALHGVRADATAVADALAGVGLAKRSDIPARRLSAGQRRRIGLARLSLDPARLWILDEPLAALDAEGEQLFAERLRAHVGAGGAALVATHHDLGTGPAREVRLA